MERSNIPSVTERLSGIIHDKVTISVRGKTAGSFNPLNGFYYLSVQYLNMSKSKKFLRISAYSDSDICEKNAIYKYDTKTKKLKCVLELPTYPMRAENVTSISSSQIKVAFSGQPTETGRINCTLTYVYKNGKFKLKSTTATAKSAIGSFYSSDSYGKYFRSNKYKVSKKLKFYTSTSQKKTAFTAKKGDILKLRKIKISGKNVYLQFQKGSKTGWRKVFNAYDKVYDCSNWQNIANSGWFYGVHNRLAG